MNQEAIFVPAVKYIASITQAEPAVVVTTTDHNYISGVIIRFYIPDTYGMQQINLSQAPITVLSSTSFSVPINTINFDPFSVPVSPKENAQVVPIGEISDIFWAPKDNILT